MAQQTKQKTAVEWLIQELLGFGLLDADDGLNSGLFKKAREMDKQQHGNTWDAAIKAHDDRGHVHARSIVDFDEYYQETFKK